MGISLKQLFPQFNPETEQVSDADFRNQSKINSLFQLLFDENTVLKINFRGKKTVYSSCVIDVDLKKSCFTIDELHPIDGHKLIAGNGNFIGQATVKGVNVSFHTSLIKLQKKGQFNSYVCDIPGSISYLQRRSEYRVRICEPLSYEMTAHHNNSPQIIQGKIRDISMQGMGVDLSTNQIIKPGENLTNCKLTLSKGESINVTLEVRHIESTSTGKYRVGGKFQELNTRLEEIICKFVREMERTAIKKS